jgi:F-type H+-transporting ATPase subunit delta
MAKGASARRHAQAIFQIATERDELERWQADLKLIAERLKYPQLTTLLQTPKLHFGEKVRLLQNIAAGINPLAMNLISLLVAKNRLEIIDSIAAEYERLVDAYQGRGHAEVITAVPLDGGDKERIKARLEALAGKEIVLTTQVDPNLMGGLVVKMGDKLLDGSVYTKLQELRKSLSEASLEVK